MVTLASGRAEPARRRQRLASATSAGDEDLRGRGRRARRRPHSAAREHADQLGGRRRRRRASRTPTTCSTKRIVHQSTGHQPMEPRTAMAYWQNGKLYLHGSTQSVARTVANVAQWVGIPQDRRRRHQRIHRRRVRRQDSRARRRWRFRRFCRRRPAVP